LTELPARMRLPAPGADPADALIPALRAGDPGAFRDLVHLLGPRVWRIAIGMLRHEQDAREVVQETFLNVHRHLDRFRGDAPLGAWVGRIAKNAALMRLRTRRRKPETPLDDPDGGPGRELAHPGPGAHSAVEAAQLGERIRAAIERLPDRYREVLLLADDQELSMLEIAQALEISVPNVKTRLHRARLAVRAALEADEVPLD
jgi:RNA polymerase sigma-70 factor (ECF subfamily)